MLLMNEKHRIDLQPKQPYFLNATSHYRKHVMGCMGISHFYAFIADDMDYTAFGIPDDSIDIMYCCDESKPEIILSGTGFAPRPLLLCKGEYYFGVRFLPGFIPQFNSISFAEIVTKDIFFDELAADHESYESIISSRSFEEQISSFLKMYCTKYYTDDFRESYDLKNFIVREIIDNHGVKKIKEIVEESGYSDRYVTNVFKANFGMTPKRFSEIIKFQNILREIQNDGDGDVNFMDLAMEGDYYDESHMLRSFRRFLNETPGEYLEFIKSELYNNKLDIV